MMLKVHFLGIGGSGASAIAALAQAQGYQISGCDKEPFNEFTRVFDQKILLEGHSPQHLNGVDILAVTPAVFSLDADNPELLAAKEKGIRIMTWQQFMGEFLEKDKFVIAVCGTHGKSTTTAMVGQLLEDAGLDPTVEIGAIVPRWGKNYRTGQGRPVLSPVEGPVLSAVEGYFVTEADEFNENFLSSHPQITIVTTIEMDHPEYYKDFETYQSSFGKFFNQTKGEIIANRQDPGVQQVLASHLSGGNVIIDYSKELIGFSLKVPGQHNVMNASAVYQLGLALGLDSQVIQKSLENFTGIGRRFEHLGSYREAEIYSDFAHHPTEIRVTLQTAREKFPDQQIKVIFQPHMFSRTHALFNDFVQVLRDAPVDQIQIMDIYPSREVDTGLVNSHQLIEAIKKGSVTYLGPGHEVLNQIRDKFQKGDVVFFMGAGITDKLAKDLLDSKL